MQRRTFFINRLLEVVSFEWLKKLNRVLTVLSVVCASLFVMDLILVSPKNDWIHKKPELLRSGKKENPELKEIQNLQKQKEPLEGYLTSIAGRNIFGAAPVEKTAAAAGNSPGELVLVGIVLGGNPKAILADKTSQMNYYLSKNQTLNDMTVEDIQEKKVVVRYKNGERATLTI